MELPCHLGPNTGASSVKDKSRAGFVPLCLQKGIKSLLSVQVFDAFLQILLCASTVKHCSKETDCIRGMEAMSFHLLCSGGNGCSLPWRKPADNLVSVEVPEGSTWNLD